MVEWRVAKSLDVLLAEVNDRWPHRSKDSDGSIGDASHQTRDSDHNPWVTDPPGPNVVTARDITHDPKNGCDSYALAQWLVDHKDPRIKYIISNRRIAAGSEGPSPWVWRPYHGANPHDHHVHISVKSDKAHFDSTKPWGLTSGGPLVSVDQPHPEPVPPTLRRGRTGPLVETLQRKLNVLVDGQFGQHTEQAVENFQKAHGLRADGIVGPQTWKLLA